MHSVDRAIVIRIACVYGLLAAPVAASEIDLKAAAECFAQAERLSKADAGKLWGVELYGPMLFVDPATRSVVANQADPAGELRAEGGLFVGTLPKNVPIANYALDWAKMRWTMLLWPLPGEDAARGTLMMHECFHRVQNRINLPAGDARNPHLDSMDGRVWLQLEWRALRAALLAEGAPRKQAIDDALTFRARRRAFFPDAAAAERGLENHEGLAEYTGGVVARGTGPDARRWAADALTDAEKKDTFVRSFAYASGPAYGLLLDAFGVDWRKEHRPDVDLGVRLAQAAEIAEAAASELARLAEQRSDAYQGAALRVAEEAREQRRREIVAGYRKRLVDGPVLRLPLSAPKTQFNPSGLVPLGDEGTIYPTITVIDAFGTIEVTGGAALLGADFKLLRVSAPASAGTPTSGDGWKLELNPGWRVVPAARAGDFELKRE
jgi:hypothetical protein